jgi:hypothetical protein
LKPPRNNCLLPGVLVLCNIAQVAERAAIVYARLSSAWSRETLNRIGRILLGVCAASFTLEQAIYIHATAILVPRWLPPNQMFWAVTTTVLFALAAVALLTNRMALLATRLLTMMLVIFGYSCGYRCFFRIPTIIRIGAKTPRPSRLPEQHGFSLISSATIGLMTIAPDDLRCAGSREVFHSRLYPPR